MIAKDKNNNMKEKSTTIKLGKETKERLDKLKVYKRESYDEVIQKILEILNLVRSNPDQARSKLLSIDKDKSWKRTGEY